LADVLAKYDINVNSVCPGGVDTAMLREVADVYGALLDRKSEDVYAQMVSKHLRRHTQPIEVARVISFLLSDDALLIRGQSINVDAGETLS
ncbi:SDR family oxidoreductase, partial [Salmonella enterica subsp. enterica serovar Saintpaul]|nr:SDR family oxidoreductase [Salmonella enterica subsp. enterica serovar Saintpaul]